jgi:hypothetical protein
MLPSLATLSLSPVDGRRVARVGAPMGAPMCKNEIARLKAISDAIDAINMVHRVGNCTQDLKKECVDSSNASSLTIADSEPDILDKIMSTAVLQSTSPCQRITDICRLSKKIKCNPGLYDLLNQRLGWYGEHGSLEEVKKYLANKAGSSGTRSIRFLRPAATAKSWFLFCCHIYRGYGTWYDFMSLASEESEEDATEEDTNEEDEATKAAREARKLREDKWYNDWLFGLDTRQRDAKILGIPTISEMNDILKETTAPSPPPTFEPLKDHDKWILDAVVDSYKRYYVADSIETKITKYFAEITEALDLTDGLTTDHDQLENIHDGWFNNEPNLLFAIGSFGRMEDFWNKVEDDSKLKRLRKAMERMPTTEELEEKGMPKIFYRIIYKSKNLAKFLREHSASEIKEMSEEIKAMFIAASGVGVEGNQYCDDDCNDVCFDSFCPAYDFMRDLLLTWLRLPQLAGYVFDEGDLDSQGDEAEHFGYFRPRKDKEQILGRSIFAGE